jgi:GNAT superfamily N-acetyltransferase
MEVVRDASLGGEPRIRLTEVDVPTPYRKDYDAIPDNAPGDWPSVFDVSRWGLLVACSDDRWLGADVLAFDTPALEMLEGRTDITVLWDIRVTPDSRRKGVGTRLFDAATGWAIRRACKSLKVETQNVNVPACRFYARQGCVLRGARVGAYREFPDEVQLLWYRHLSS